jgi:hypothetical protein
MLSLIVNVSSISKRWRICASLMGLCMRGVGYMWSWRVRRTKRSG